MMGCVGGIVAEAALGTVASAAGWGTIDDDVAVELASVTAISVSPL